jgi:hypothetical protein
MALFNGGVRTKLPKGIDSLDKTASFDQNMWMLNAQRRLSALPKKTLENRCDVATRNYGHLGRVFDAGAPPFECPHQRVDFRHAHRPNMNLGRAAIIHDKIVS